MGPWGIICTGSTDVQTRQVRRSSEAFQGILFPTVLLSYRVTPELFDTERSYRGCYQSTDTSSRVHASQRYQITICNGRAGSKDNHTSEAYPASITTRRKREPSSYCIITLPCFASSDDGTTPTQYSWTPAGMVETHCTAIRSIARLNNNYLFTHLLSCYNFPTPTFTTLRLSSNR